VKRRRDINLLVVAPGLTSSGGIAFGERLVSELEVQLGREVGRAETPRLGRLQLDRHSAGATHVLFLGSRAIEVAGARTVLWPLNVAPFDARTVHAPSSSVQNRARHRLLLHRLRRSVGCVDGLVFGSHYARSLYLARFADAATMPYRVIRGGARSLEVADGTEGRRDGGLILCVSHLYPYKGILELVEAVAIVDAELPPAVTVRIAGADRDRRYAAAVRKRIMDRGLDHRIEVRAATGPELQSLYAEAEVAVFMSTCENAGSFALYDGLHAGCPTICSDRSSMPEMVEGAVRLVNPFEPHAVGSAIVGLLRDPSERQVLAARAQAWSAKVPSWGDRAAELIEFFEELDA
jgi:glycosyltransferase involved in cell wall biosynthesis